MKKLFKIIILLILTLVQHSIYSQAILDDFNATIKGYPHAQAMAIQSDGKIMIGGKITMVGDEFVDKILRLNSDGTLDETFSPQETKPDDLYAIISTTDDKVLILYNDHNIFSNNMELLNTDGTLDVGFEKDPNINDVRLAYELENEFLIFAFLQGVGNSLLKINKNGTLVESFQPVEIDGNLSQISVLEDGRIGVSGFITKIGGQSASNIAILNSDGTTDTSFSAPDFDNDVFGFVVTDDNQIMVYGYFFELNGNPIDRRIFRLNSDGSLDQTFTGQIIQDAISGSIEDIKMLEDGSLLIAGVHSAINFFGKRIIKINVDGTLNIEFNIPTLKPSNGSSFIRINTTNSGDLYAYGFFKEVNNDVQFGLAKFDLSGNHDKVFNARLGNSPNITSATLQVDGKSLITGKFYEINGIRRENIARLNSDGSIDNTFNPNIATRDFDILSSAIQSDGKFLIGGFLSTLDVNNQNLIRLNTDGTFDNTFQTNIGNLIEDILVLTNDDIIVGGVFSSVNGISRNNLVKLSTDGIVEESFNSTDHLTSKQMIKQLALQSDGKILLGGNFDYSSGLLLRVDQNGELDETFNSPQGLDFFINTISVNSDNSFVGGGLTFMSQGSDTNAPLYQFSSDGTLLDKFSIGIQQPRLNSSINYTGVIHISNDEVILTGSFNSINDKNLIGLAKTTLSGFVDDNFNFAIDAFSPLVLNAEDDNILVFGDFQKVNEKTHHGAVKIKYLNDIPEIVGLSRTIEINEDEVYEFDAGDLLVEDVDDIYPDVFDINIIGGNSYTVDGNKIIPKADFFGELLVAFEIIDSKGASDQLTSTINVMSVNDLPVINDQIDISTDEDVAVSLSLDMLQISDPDNTYPDDFTLTLLPGDNYTFEGLNVTPNKDFDQELLVNVVVNDGTDDSDTFELAIGVTPVNDPPIILEQSEVLLLNLFKGVDASTRKFEIPLDILEISDPDNTNADFTGIILDGQGYTVEKNTFFVNDNADAQFNVLFKVNDGNLDSEQFDVAVELQVVSSLENASLEQSVTIYPNPASDRLILSINEYQTKSLGISISDISGRTFYATLRENTSNTFNEQIDISRLPVGLYMLTLKSETGIVNQKFLKK